VVIEVRFFASLSELTGRSAESIEIDPSADVEALWRLLAERHPALAGLSYRPLVACDLVYAEWDRRLEGVAEVAFLPPVSGG
jgi:molybdopterin converting factor subunit 1